MSNADAGATFSRLDLVRVVRRDWWIVALAGLLCATAGLLYSLAQNPVYSSSATLYVTSGVEDDSAAAAYQGSMASQQRVASYANLVTSDLILRRALDASGLELSLGDAKQSMSAAGKPRTVLLTVSAESEDPAVASRLANATADALVFHVAELERPSGGGEALAKLTVVSAAEPSDRPVSPSVTRNTAYGLLAGLLIGGFLVALRYRFDTKIRGEADIRTVSDAPVLSEVPNDGSLDGKGPVDFGVGASAVAEGFRRLRTNLAFVDVDKPVRRILVTSPVPGEGKTTTAVNLSLALAEAGKRVVLLDADMRRPTVDIQLAVSGTVGLSNYLLGGCELEDVVQNTKFPNLDVMVAGHRVPNPSELLGSKAAERCVEILAANYDYVVIDSPPLVPVADAPVIGQYVDGAIVVIRDSVSTKPDLKAALTQLKTANVKLYGILLNGRSGGRNSSYGYGYTDQERSSMDRPEAKRERKNPSHRRAADLTPAAAESRRGD